LSEHGETLRFDFYHNSLFTGLTSLVRAGIS